MRKNILFTFLFLAVLSNAIADDSCLPSIDFFLTPALYDNAVVPVATGQTFVARNTSLFGVRLFIGDPTRPNDPSVGPIQGPADLVLYNATDLSNPIELKRTQIVSQGETLSGEVELNFSSEASTVPGTRYFVGIETAFGFGIALTDQFSSFYSEGSEATLDATSGIIEHFSGRDVSFRTLDECSASASLAGTVKGILLGKVVCVNLTTGQRIVIRLQGSQAWDCSASGLIVNPGDQVRMKITGLAD